MAKVNAHKILFKELKAKRAFERSLNTWDYNIKIHLKETAYEGTDHSQLIHDTKPRGLTKGGEFLDTLGNLYEKHPTPCSRKKICILK